MGIDLPTLNDIDNIIPIPQAILDLCVKRRKEVPMYSQGLSPVDATWEDVQTLQLRFPKLSKENS